MTRMTTRSTTDMTRISDAFDEDLYIRNDNKNVV